VQFVSDAFPAYDGEEAQINPGRWGRRLAECVQAGLRSQGLEVQELIREDWGWMVPIENPGFGLRIGCGTMDGDNGNEFACFIEPSRKNVWRWFRRINTEKQVTAVAEALDRVLSRHPAIHDLQWDT
jgi:hypothetical protein